MNNNKKEISNGSRKTNYQVRELEKNDLDSELGFLETLSNLAEVGNLSLEKAEEVLEIINAQGSRVFVAVNDEGQIMGSVTLMLEQKFLREGKLAGHIEDVVTRKGYEGMGVASALMKKAVEIAQESGCYKLILDCHERLIPFYQKFGFKETGIEMKMYF
jgi:glucosamine-phosphate N-acetyltransferase